MSAWTFPSRTSRWFAPSATSPFGCRLGRSRGARLSRCLVCPSVDLFVRKDFPQRLGVGLVLLGVVGSSISWGYGWTITTFAILFATALLDVVLYMIVPNALMCYRCGAQYRQVVGLDQHAAFDLEVHERHRQAKHRGRPKRRGCRPELRRRRLGDRAGPRRFADRRLKRSSPVPLASGPRLAPRTPESRFRVPWIKNASESKTICAGW